MAKDPLPSKRNQIIDQLNKVSQLKSKVYDQTLEVFTQLKDVLAEISSDINEEFSNNNRRLRLEYRDRGKFEAELKFADDVLVFSMHTDIFQFDRDHSIWKNDILQKDATNGYCGVINIYNFLSDSLKFNRAEDLGYLVARVFINKDNFFFTEGKRQKRQQTNEFGKYILDRSEIISMVETAMLYAISFDLLVPPYDFVKVASVDQINAKIESAKIQTAKRLGYAYSSDDVLNGVEE